MSDQPTETRKWWHAWGGAMTDPDWGGCWAMVVLGSSPVPPEGVAHLTPPAEVTRLGLGYLHSWDHEPSDEEKEALTPEEYLDDPPAAEEEWT